MWTKVLALGTVLGTVLAVACSSDPLTPDEHVAANENDPACIGLSQVTVEPGHCVRIVPKANGPSVGHGPTCDELTWLDPPGETCAAWVAAESQAFWVNDADVSVVRWTGACSCR